MATKGFTLKAGIKGEKVKDDVAIFVSKMCLTHAKRPNRGVDSTTPEIEKPKEGLTQTTIEDQRETTVIQNKQKMTLDKAEKWLAELEDKYAGIAQLGNVMQWITDIEQYVDSLPNMKSDGKLVNYVEQNDAGDWIYTGESALPDPAWNRWAYNFKRKICDGLQSLLDKTTKKAETYLNNLEKQLETCGPFNKIMQVVSKVPSLTTIIDWAKGIIDFVVGIFKMIYTTYQLVMTLLEMIIVKVPQIISKIIKKITEYECDLVVQKPKVQFKMNLQQAVTEKEKEKPTKKDKIKDKVTKKDKNKISGGEGLC